MRRGDAGLRVAEFFWTSPARIGELFEKIAAATPGCFKRNRPHGVLIIRVAAIGNGCLVPVAGDPVKVLEGIIYVGPWIAVETMGFADEDYRERKATMHQTMSWTLGDAPVVLHEFHGPPGSTQGARDKPSWMGLMRLVTGKSNRWGMDGGRHAGAAPRQGRCGLGIESAGGSEDCGQGRANGRARA